MMSNGAKRLCKAIHMALAPFRTPGNCPYFLDLGRTDCGLESAGWIQVKGKDLTSRILEQLDSRGFTATAQREEPEGTFHIQVFKGTVNLRTKQYKVTT